MLQTSMLISFWLIFNHSYDEKPALYYILYYLMGISTNVYVQLVEDHYSNSVNTSSNFEVVIPSLN